MTLKLHLFGSPRLMENEQEIPINRAKAKALLAYLAITNRPHSRATLATLLWEGMPDQRHMPISAKS